MNIIPYMLKVEKFEELNSKNPELKRYYQLQNNGFYKVNVSEKDREYLKDCFRKLGFSALNFTDSRSIYQFYNLERLWADMQLALEAGITVWHPATEPVSAGEVYEYLTGEKFVNKLGGIPANYDYKTIHAELFGGEKQYIYHKKDVLESIKEFEERWKSGKR